jgi:hypothetical protein
VKHALRGTKQAGIAVKNGDNRLGLKRPNPLNKSAQAILIEFGGWIIQQQGRSQSELRLEVFELA